MACRLHRQPVAAEQMPRHIARRNPRQPRRGDEDMGKVLAHAALRRERRRRRRRGRGAVGVEQHLFVQRAVDAVEQVERLRPALRRLGRERPQRLVRLRQFRRAQEHRRRQVGRQALHHPRAILGNHPAGRGNCQLGHRCVDVEHVDDVAITVAALAQPRIAIDVDPPFQHRLRQAALRRQAQRLDDVGHRPAEAVARAMLDGEAHQGNRNCCEIAASSWLFSAI